MEANIRVVSFFEDVAQERLIGALIDRIAEDAGVRQRRLRREARVAEPGARVHEQFESFVKQRSDELSGPDVVLVVAIDCNCRGRNERKRQLEDKIWTRPRKGKKVRAAHVIVPTEHVAFCLPDPHIERWYIADQHAFNDVIGAGAAPKLPAYKCERDYYKNMLREALIKAGIRPILGGAEYGELIAQKIDLEQLRKADPAFESFEEELRGALKLVSSGLS